MKSMKRIFTLIMALACMGMTVFAQAPTKINYQVVARDADNAVIQEQPVSVQIDILQGSATGTSVYTETLNTTTNFDGLLSLEVNAGEIDWANGPYFIQTTVEGNVISTVQLMAVPYAFYAAKAATDFSGKYEDLKNKPEIPVIPTKTSEYDNDVPYVTKEAQELSIDGDKLTISDGNTVDLPTANHVEYIPVNKPKTGDMLYWDNDKQEWVLIQGGKAGDVLAYFEKPEWAAMDEEGNITQKEEDKGCGTLTDIEGNEYKTIIIGTQCWMAEDLRVKTLPNGTKMTRTTTWNTGVYWDLDDPVQGYFVLYPWRSAANRTSANTNQTTKIQGICPDGWHLPSYTEWGDMCKAIDPDYNPGSVITSNTSRTQESSNKLGIKLAGNDSRCQWFLCAGINATGARTYSCPTPDEPVAGDTYKNLPNTPGYSHPAYDDPDFNASGFNAIPHGYLNRKDHNYMFNGSAMFWTSISNSVQQSHFVRVNFDVTGHLYARWSDGGNDYLSVRCLSDQSFPQE